MKKIMAIMLASTTLLFACKKDYNCRCKYYYEVPQISATVDADSLFTIKKVTKKKAKNACSDADVQLKAAVSSFSNSSATCYID